MKTTLILSGLARDCTDSTINFRATWKDKLRWRFFPARHVDLPQAPKTYKDMLVCRVTCQLSMLDRIRVLISGRLMVESKTVTENEIGKHITASVAYPLPIKTPNE